MCGLVGVAGTIEKKDLDVFNDLLTFDQVRGPHSTGVAGVTRFRKEIEVFKMIGGPENLMAYKNYDKVVNGAKMILLGHNRFATMGGIKQWNAHPFEFRHVVGAHNGTIASHIIKKLGDTYADDYDTDSEGLISSINDNGIEETIGKLQGSGQAAWCLTWYDDRNNTMNFLRNKERPLYICRAKSGKTIYWASEWGMLVAALGRRGIEFDPPELLDIDVLTSFTMGEANAVIAAPLTSELKAPEPPPVTSSYGRQDYVGGWRGVLDAYGEDGGEAWEGTNVRRFPRQDVSKDEKAAKEAAAAAAVTGTSARERFKEHRDADLGATPLITRPVGTRVKHYKCYGELLDQEAFEKWVGPGCAYCEGGIEWGSGVRFLKHDDGTRGALCSNCLKDEGITELLWQQGALK